jgi:hypothetical protein
VEKIQKGLGSKEIFPRAMKELGFLDVPAQINIVTINLSVSTICLK